MRARLPLPSLQRRQISSRALLNLPDDIKTADRLLPQIPYMSSPHWESEALVPQFKGRAVQTFRQANAKKDKTEAGRVFLRANREGLVRAANAVVGYKADLTRGTTGTGTAFQVGAGVYATHNHFQSGTDNHIFEGNLPSKADGKPFELTPQFLDDESIKETIVLETQCHPYYRERKTSYLVMLKTLQQARYQGIWKPCSKMLYKWEGKMWETAASWDLAKWDFGVCKLAKTNSAQFNRTTSGPYYYEADGRLYPSLRVGSLENGDVLAALGFPSIPNEKRRSEWDKTPEKLWQYYSGAAGQLRACVGSARYCGFGYLFGQKRIELIGVQNVIGKGSSGGPIISISDLPGRFLGITIGQERHQNEYWNHYRGNLYMSVDSPLVIATYLQYILPSYPLNGVPKEILAYLDRDKRFCKWFVEVAWQRLSPSQRTSKLQKHWSQFGNLERPTHEMVPVDDAWDDWRGIGEIHARQAKDVIPEMWEVRRLMRYLAWPELGERARSWRRRVAWRKSEVW